jgi:hypothetical protein
MFLMTCCDHNFQNHYCQQCLMKKIILGIFLFCFNSSDICGSLSSFIHSFVHSSIYSQGQINQARLHIFLLFSNYYSLLHSLIRKKKRPNTADKWAAFLLHIWEVLGFNMEPKTSYIDKSFVIFSVIPCKDIYLISGQNCFLSHSFKIIIH